MTSISQVGEQLKQVMEERANQLGRQLGCIQRHRKLSGADLVQTLIFGFQEHPHASLEQLVSMAEIRNVSVSDTALHKRFTRPCAELLHALLQEMTAVVVQAAQDVPVALLRRFRAVILEDSTSIALPNELASLWQGCGGNRDHTSAALKLHVRWELKRGRLWGPELTAGRRSDHASPFNDEPSEAGALYVEDLGYFSLSRLAQRHRAGAYSLTRLHAGTALFTAQGQRLCLQNVLPRQVGQMKELRVVVGARERLPMRLLLLRVPQAVAEQRREDLLRDAQRRGQTISQETLRLADWTILITDVPPKRLRFEQALVLLRERWQMELLYKLWKQEGQVDEWQTDNCWRVLCELYAKLMGALLQHWLIVLFAWQDPERSLVKLAQVVRDTGWTLMEALAGHRPLRSALLLIGRRMRSGCHMNRRKKHPNSAQLLAQERVEWPLSWCE